MSMFRKAEKKKSKLRLALTGVAGSGKTLSAIKIAKGLSKKIVLIDTERGSGDLYSSLGYDIFSFNPPYSPDKLIKIIAEAEKEGYETIIIDSLSHFWSDEGGVLSLVDTIAAGSKSKNSYVAWNKGTEIQNKMINTILGCNMHAIITLRTKSAYEMQEINGKKQPIKIGLAPIQRDNLDYEFAVVLDIDKESHFASVAGNGKDRTGIFDGNPPFLIDENTGIRLLTWLNEGTDASHSTKTANSSPGKTTKVTKSFGEILDDVEQCDNISYVRNYLKKYGVGLDEQEYLALQEQCDNRIETLKIEFKERKNSEPTPKPDDELTALRAKAFKLANEKKIKPAHLKNDCIGVSSNEKMDNPNKLSLEHLNDLITLWEK